MDVPRYVVQLRASYRFGLSSGWPLHRPSKEVITMSQNEESLPATIFGLVLVGFVFWIIAPELDPYMPFTLKWFAVICWGGAVLIVVSTVASAASSVGGR